MKVAAAGSNAGGGLGDSYPSGLEQQHKGEMTMLDGTFKQTHAEGLGKVTDAPCRLAKEDKEQLVGAVLAALQQHQLYINQLALLKKAERIAIVGDSKSARDKTLLKRAMLLQ
jgi:hypothetical protein